MVIEQLTLEADLVVRQVVRVESGGFVELAGVETVQRAAGSAARVQFVRCHPRNRSAVLGDARQRGRLTGERTCTVEAARAEPFRIGVVGHHILVDVPGEVAAEAVPALALLEIDREAAVPGGGASAV